MSLYTHISLFLFVLKIFVFKRIVRPMGVIQVGFSFLDEFSWISKYLLYFIKLNILQLLIVIEVYSWYVSLLCQTLEGRSQISNWISDTLTYCPPCPNCDKFYTSRCSDSGSSGACAPLFDQIVQSVSVNQPWARLRPNWNPKYWSVHEFFCHRTLHAHISRLHEEWGTVGNC